MSRELPYPEVLPTIDPRWRTSDVMGVARGIHKERAFDRLPILCDALMDAGCEDEAIFDHFLGKANKCGCCDGHGTLTWVTDDKGSNQCHVCKGAGTIRRGHSYYPFTRDEGRGCWERQCWLVNHILGEPQPIAALIPWGDGRISDDAVMGTVINPGDHYGKTWMVFCDGTYDPPRFMVEADNRCDAIDDFIDSEWGEIERIAPEDMSDYLEDKPDSDGTYGYRCDFTGNGHPYDGENVHAGGDDHSTLPYHCVYIGPGLPKEGIDPRLYAGRRECFECGKEFYPMALDLYGRPVGEFCSDACFQVHASAALEEAELIGQD